MKTSWTLGTSTASASQSEWSVHLLQNGYHFSFLHGSCTTKTPSQTIVFMVANWPMTGMGVFGHYHRQNIQTCSLPPTAVLGARCTRDLIPWAAESSYVIPVCEKDGVCHASEGRRLGPNQIHHNSPFSDCLYQKPLFFL